MKVVKHARFGRDVDADPLPTDTEKCVPIESEDDVPEYTEADQEGTGGESENVDDNYHEGHVQEAEKRPNIGTDFKNEEYNNYHDDNTSENYHAQAVKLGGH